MLDCIVFAFFILLFILDELQSIQKYRVLTNFDVRHIMMSPNNGQGMSGGEEFGDPFDVQDIDMYIEEDEAN